MPVLKEAVVEAKVTQYAQEVGCLAVKLNLQGRRGWPDRLYMYKGQVLFIEFKRPGEQPRKLQEYTHELIRKHGFRVEVVDSVERGYRTIDNLTFRRPDL